MFRFLTKEEGITLIEVLATITILSIVSILLYGVLNNGLDYSKKSQKNVTLQQEMNILITSITKLHESNDIYEIVWNGDPASKIQLITKDNTGKTQKTIEFANYDYEYSLSLFQYDNVTNKLESLSPGPINSASPLHVEVIIKDKKNGNKTLETKTIISRL